MKKSFISCLFASSLPICPLISLTSCAGNNMIVLANFESYMNPDLIDKYDGQVNFLYYQTNEEIESKFKGYYDLAIPSTYEIITLLEKQWLQKIEWEKFGLYDSEGNLITNGIDALKLFIDPIQHIIKSTTNMYSNLFKPDENLLDYCIPYFLQSFMFAYKGDAISELDNAANWDEYLNFIGDRTNPNVPDVFKPKKTNRIGCIDDGRTFYDLCHLIKMQKTNPNNPERWHINVDNENASIDDLKDDFNYFTSKFTPNHFYFNSDSQVVLESLSTPKDGNLSSFAYNGDILYAAMGADLYDPYSPDEFHIDNLDAKPLALDALVINNKNDKNPDKLNKIYDLIKSLFLDHIDSSEISEMNDDGYIYDPMTNFDFVRYTSPFKSIDDYVNGDYFIDTDDTLTEDQIELYKSIYNIEVNPKIDIINLIEAPISDLSKSNMHWAYVEKKQEI